MENVVDSFKKTVVPMQDREGTLFGVFGSVGQQFERMVFIMMDKLDASYKGGFWEFVHVESAESDTPKSFYMYPVRKEAEVECRWEDNFSRENVSPEVAGIIATLFALSHLSFSVRPEMAATLSDKYEGLMAYAMTLPEAPKILSLID